MTAGFVRRFWLSLACTGISGAAIANPGDLDPSFGSGGRVFFNVREHYEAATSIVQARDGKLLVGRWVYNWPAADDFSVLRLRDDGSMDPTFDGDGRTFAELAGARGVTRTVLELASGRIIAAGEVTNEDGLARGFGLVRFEATGAVDRSFGVNGVVQGTFNGRVGSIEGIVEQPDGSLVAAGYLVANDRSSDMAIVRFEPTGALDTTFGTSGLVSIDFSAAGHDDAAYEILRQADGKLVVAGLAFDEDGLRNLAVLRLTIDGSLDPTFGLSGRVMVDALEVESADVSLREQGGGRLVLSGQERTAGGDCSAVIVRLNPDGTPDTTFQGGGLAQVPLGACYAAGASNLVTEPDGSVVVASTMVPEVWPSDIKVSRLTPSGELDRTFGSEGTTIVDMGSGGWSSRVDPSLGAGIVRQSDGRIVLAASDQFDWEFGGDFFMVARLLASGGSAGMIGLTTDFFVVDEASTTVMLTVRRTGGATGAASVNFTTVFDSAGNAADAADFTPVSGTLTWEDGDASDRTIPIQFADDSQAEGAEVLQLVLSHPSGAPLATDRMLIFINDDEEPPAQPPPPVVTTPPGSTGGGALDWLLLVALAGIFRRRSPANVEIASEH